VVFDGMRYNSIGGTAGGAWTGAYVVNAGIIQEIAIDTSGASSEAETSGVRANIVPKQGGNRFATTLFANFANDSAEPDFDSLTPPGEGGRPS
jgi:hypothetical protein